jgi:mono/diheme cytochrome c family protein
MMRALAATLLVGGIGLGTWALVAAENTPDQPAPAGQSPEAAGPPASNETAGSEAQAPTGAAPKAESEGATEGAAADADPSKAPKEGATAEDAAPPAAGGGGPLKTAQSAEKGTLKSSISDAQGTAAEGHKVYMAAGCNGCHGGTGGGGMGPPLTNQVWVYGSDDDTLFRLIALGSDELKKQGYNRKGSENVVGPMPAQGTIVKSDEDLWKIIAWIRSINPSSGGAATTSSAPEAAPKQ